MRVIALISAYNEGDVIYHVIGDLIANGVEVYLIDNNSGDDTVREAARWLGKGLLHIERFPEDAGYRENCKREYVWREILKRKEELALTLGADWYIHADADEFRESPWEGLTLKEGIQVVDAMGHSAIDFELLNFRPTDDRFLPGSDVREALTGFERSEAFNVLQVKCWKNLGAPVEIEASGGHDISFAGRSVFPVKFLLRHYPIRSQAHGLKKVFEDRKKRFNAKEREHGWHIQYDHIVSERHNFLHDEKSLIPYDAKGEKLRILSAEARRRAALSCYEELKPHLAAGERENALLLLKELVRRHPECAVAHNDLAVLCQEKGESEEALLHYRRAVALEPGNAVFAMNLADLYFVAFGRDREAITLYLEVIGKDPDDCDALLNLAKICLATDRAEDARAVLERLLSRRPEHREAARLLSESFESDDRATAIAISVIIPVYNQAPFTARCLETLYAATPASLNFEVIVVDNASTDSTAALLDRAVSHYPNLKVIRNDENLFFAKGCNVGARGAAGQVLVFLNNDTEPQRDWLERLTEPLQRQGDIGLVGAKLLYPDRTLQHGGMVFVSCGAGPEAVFSVHRSIGTSEDDPQVNQPEELTAVTGACIAITSELFGRVGGFCEDYGMYYEDVDLCLKVRGAGKKVFYEPRCVVIHHEQKSSPSQQVAKALDAKARVIFLKKWGELLPSLVQVALPPTRILWLRPDSIGDNVLASSMLPHVKKNYPGCTLTVLCQEHVAELYQNSPFVDEIITFNLRRAFEDEGYRNGIVARLREVNADIALNSLFSRAPLHDFFTVGSGAKERVALFGDLSNISAAHREENNRGYTRLIDSPGEWRPELARHRDFLRGLGIEAPPLTPVVWTGEEDERFAEEFFRTHGLDPAKTVALFAGAQFEVRVYDHYGAALAPVLRGSGFTVIALGSAAETELNRKNLEAAGVPGINLSGKLTLRQTAALLRRCRLAVGAETGTAHIACAVGTPNVVLLGGGHFGRFMPYSPLTTVACLPLSCFRCNWGCGFSTSHCVKDLHPEVISAALRSALAAPSEKTRVFYQAGTSWRPLPGEPGWQECESLLSHCQVEPVRVTVGQGSALDAAPRAADAKKYLVSAIVSTYNAERFIAGKLKDLEAQTIADRLEIIVIDSGSKENERKVVEEFQKRYDNIRYLRTERRETVYQAWNRGIRMASGEFIANANTDDRLRQDAFEVLTGALEAHPEAVLAYADMRITLKENETFEGHTKYGFKTWPEFSRLSLLELCCVGPFPLWRRSLHDAIGYFDERFKSAADYEFWLRAALEHSFVHVPEFLGLYWLNEETVSRKGELPTLEYLQIQKLYREKYAPLTPCPPPLPPEGAKEYRRLMSLIDLLGEDAPDTALAHLERFLEGYPDFPQGHHDLGELYYRKEEIGLAKKHFEKAAILSPGEGPYLEKLTGVLRLEFYQSLQYHTRCLAEGKEELETLLSLGMICQFLERCQAARGHYERVLELDPHNALARGNLALLSKTPPSPSGNHLPSALPSPLTGREEGEGEVAPHRRLVSIIIPISEGIDAVTRCLDSIERHTPEAYEIILVDNGADEATVAALTALCRVKPGCRLLERGASLDFFDCLMGRIAASSGDYLCLVQSDCQVGAGWLAAIALSDKPLCSAADLAPLSEGISTRLVTSDAMRRARLLGQKGRLDEAVDLLLQEGIRFSPQAPAPYLLLAQLLEEGGRYDQALEVLELIPGNPPVSLPPSARCRLQLGDIEAARRLAELALAASPVSAPALHAAAEVALAGGDAASAAPLLSRALAIDPGCARAYRTLAKLSGAKGDREQALALAERAFRLRPCDMETLALYHEHSKAQGSTAREEELIREALELFPQHRGLRFGLIHLFLERGELSFAMAEIERALADFPLDDALIDAALSVRDRLGPRTPARCDRPTVSLCMIVKDEGANLPRALFSALPLADEIVVVDTGSTDRSADIAAVFGAAVHDFPWSGNFAEARNVSLCLAKGDFILVLDADEVLAPRDLEQLAAVIAAEPAAYLMTTRNYTESVTRRGWSANSGEYPVEEAGRGWTPSRKVRLFPNDRRIRFRGEVHELVEDTLLEAGIPILPCQVPVHHYGKLDVAKEKEKREKYYELGLLKLKEDEEDLKALVELAVQATELEKWEESTALWERVLAVEPENGEALFSLGYLKLKSAQYPPARDLSRRAWELNPDFKEAAYNAAQATLYLGEPGEAIRACRTILNKWPEYPPALALLSASCLLKGEDEGVHIQEKLRRMHFDCADYLRDHAKGLLRGGNAAEAACLEAAAVKAHAGIPVGRAAGGMR